ncbi:MAG TPA: hypothetical protein VHD87_14830 [Acidimicrobiales bacterium]|nr:hypothetical protein [Acidimicrobiales bacterium]
MSDIPYEGDPSPATPASRGCLWLLIVFIGIPLAIGIVAGLVSWNSEHADHQRATRLQRRCHDVPTPLAQRLADNVHQDLSGLSAIRSEDNGLWYIAAGGRTPGANGVRPTAYGWVAKSLDGESEPELVYGPGAETIEGVIYGHTAFGHEVTQHDHEYTDLADCTPAFP